MLLLKCVFLWVHNSCYFFCEGAAINFVKSYMLSPTAGRRPGVPGTLVILADASSSDDDATGPASEIKAAGKSPVLHVWNAANMREAFVAAAF